MRVAEGVEGFGISLLGKCSCSALLCLAGQSQAWLQLEGVSITASTAVEARSLGRCLELCATRLSHDHFDLDEEAAVSRKIGAGYNFPAPVYL